MAGDLFIENLPSKAFYFLMAAAGENGFQKVIHHANRPWAENEHRLREQLIQPTQNREHLPPHAYIQLNKSTLESFLKEDSNRQKFNGLAARLTRPLGIVSQIAALEEWDGSADKAQLLLDALDKQNIIIEYYATDGTPLMDTYGEDYKWEKVDEKTNDNDDDDG